MIEYVTALLVYGLLMTLMYVFKPKDTDDDNTPDVLAPEDVCIVCNTRIEDDTRTWSPCCTIDCFVEHVEVSPKPQIWKREN